MGADLAVARRFGTNLRQARKRADLSQEEVGARASLHRTEVGLLERGARVPRIDTLVKVAAALGVRIDCAAGRHHLDPRQHRGRHIHSQDARGATRGGDEARRRRACRSGRDRRRGRADSRKPRRTGSSGTARRAGGGMSGPNWSHRSKDQRQTQNETKTSAKLHRATDPGALGIDPGLAVAPIRQLLQPLRTTSPQHPTHYEPSGSTPGTHFSDAESRQAGEWRFRQGGRRPILARLRRANGRLYGRPSGSDLRSFAYLELGLFRNSAGHLALFSDEGGMERNTTQSPTFFTERTLAAYLAVSDRTIRNWIRRGELPSYKLGAARRIDPADVDVFLECRREEVA